MFLIVRTIILEPFKTISRIVHTYAHYVHDPRPFGSDQDHTQRSEVCIRYLYTYAYQPNFNFSGSNHPFTDPLVWILLWHNCVYYNAGNRVSEHKSAVSFLLPTLGQVT